MTWPVETKDFVLELLDLRNSIYEIVRRTGVPASTVSRWRVAEFGSMFQGLPGRKRYEVLAMMGQEALRQKRNGSNKS